MDPAIGQFIPLILIFVIFYFFLIRPQQRKAKDHKKMVEDLKRGDKIRLQESPNNAAEIYVDQKLTNSLKLKFENSLVTQT